jgi:carbamoyl-phosphate synthase small subunit
MMQDRAVLVLEDGRHFEGVGFGADVAVSGELVFNTSMSGYQEILTDPSYAGQLVTLTTAHVGNYGVNPEDMESGRIWAAGLIIRGLSREVSNWRATESLPSWMASQGVAGISEIDTRALTRHIRDKGVMRGVIARGGAADAARWVEHIKALPDYGDIDFVGQVSVKSAREAVLEADGRIALVAPGAAGAAGARHVVVMDYGVKHSILRNLLKRGVRVTLVPGGSSVAEIEAWGADGVLLSNGPGDPARMDAILPVVRELATRRPTFGICLGHQILGRAFGAQTFKLPFGHRGPNQPVKELETGKIGMTSQNHGYAVRGDGMPDALAVTHVNLNDETIAGLRHRSLPVSSVQYHPEAGPGPHDAEHFFDEFMTAMAAQTA